MIRLPDRTHVVLTGETDPIARHYQPIIGSVLNKRLEMALALLGARRFHRLLDAGYGGGVFFPELASRTEELYGIDIHPHQAEVERMARAEGLQVSLRQGSLCETGFPDGYFDGLICISVLEFVRDLSGAIAEIRRITSPKGTVILGFPGDNLFTNLGYWLARTPDPRRVHQATYGAILEAAGRQLTPVRIRQFPPLVPERLALFFVGEFERP